MFFKADNFKVSDELQRRIELDIAEDWEIPFVCDECWVFQQGGELSNISDNHRLMCISCHMELVLPFKDDVYDRVNEIVGLDKIE